MLFSVSPFTYNSMTLTNSKSNLPEIVKRMSMNRRYPVALHELVGKTEEIIQIFGESKYPEFTRKFYKIFNIHICKLIIQNNNGEIVLNHCEPCKKEEVNWNLVKQLSLNIL